MSRFVLAGVLALLALLDPAWAQQAPHFQITSFAVGPDETLTYPNDPTTPNHLVGLPDEHTTFIPPAPGGNTYLVFAASSISGGPFGAAVLQTADLTNFSFATALGYNPQVMAPPIALGQCNPTYNTEFDGNYAAPGSVVQDPTLPAGNLIMLYEAENHCPGGVRQTPFYATIGFARSSDNGKTWPPPVNGVSGGPSRHPILQSSDPQPSVAHPYMGDAIPSAFVDKNANGELYLYVTYHYHAAVYSSGDELIRVARARLGQDPLTFMKWYNGSFSQTGIGGLDSGVLPSAGCANGTQDYQAHSEISYNDDLGLYLMLYVCVSGPQGAQVGAWYYSTATSLDLQGWAAPRMILNSQFPVTTPCSADGGDQFDGWYPSFLSPGAAAGHTKLTGRAFFLNGCDLGARQFMSRTFTITTEAPPVLTSGSVANGATYFAGGLVPGSWAQVKGSSLANVTHLLAPSDLTGNILPTSLSGASVTVNGQPAPLYYISPTQIDFQVPANISGTASVQVFNNGLGSSIATGAAATSSPGIWPIIENGINYAAAVFLDGKFAGDPSIGALFRNARPGDQVQLFGTGLAPSPSGVLINSLQPLSGVTVTLGTVTVPAEAAGLVAPGEFQINFAVPPQFANMPEGNYPLTVTVNGISSPAMINSAPQGPLVIPIQH